MRYLIAVLVGFLAVLPTSDSAAADAPLVLSPEKSVQAPTTLNLPINKSQVFQVNRPIGKIAVGNSDIVDAVALTDRSFYVLGKGNGTTNLSVYGQDQKLLAVVDITVGIDVQAVKAALHEALPRETIEVRAVNDSISLGGIVSSGAKVSMAMEIAKHFLPRDKNGTEIKGTVVINNMGVSGAQQVMLQVKIAEMSRTTSQELGFHLSAVAGTDASLTSVVPTGAGFFLSALNSLTATNLSGTQSTIGGGTKSFGHFHFSEILDAQEQKGAVKILAEPNLVAMSGDTANFLAGGEFPVPTSQSINNGLPTITVEFKPFGISLAFTPTVIGDDLINLVVAPEVSQIDNQTAPVVINGFTIPGISTRRLKTTVELRDGQAFAIAGLLQSDFADKVRQIPGIGDIPIIGALSRDTDFLRHETELVIIITPRLVHPVAANTLIAPTDSFVPPNQAEIFFNGRTEAPDSGIAPKGGGLSGHYGHIVR